MNLRSAYRLVITTALAGTSLACFGLSLPALAADAPAVKPFKADAQDIKTLLSELENQKNALAKQQQTLSESMRSLREQERQLGEQKDKIRVLESKARLALGEKAVESPEEKEKDMKAQATSEGDTAAAAPVTSVASGSAPDEVGTEHKPEDKKRAPDIEVIADQGGILLPRGKLVLEPSLSYTRASSLRVAVEGFTIVPALNIGSFDIAQVDRDTLTASMGARYGLTKKLEIDIKVPYLYRSDSTLSRPIGTGAGSDVLQDVSGNNIGDIEVGAHYQLNEAKGGWPYLVGNLRLKSRTGSDPFESPIDPTTGVQTELPTGSGFYGIQPSLTAIFPSDPAVFFGNIGYLHNVGRNLGGTLGDINPGDSVSASFGMGFSINEKTSFSVGYSHSMVFETTQNGNTVPNSDVLQVGSMDFGYSYRWNKDVSLNMNVGAGLTDDAPDLRLMFKVPVALNYDDKGSL